jgi:RNA polymerase sigma-70 factor (ECF subfamily)
MGADAGGSFEGLAERLRSGNAAAAAEVVGRLAARLNALARAQLDTWVRRKVDPEDVVQSVFRSFFTRFEAGRFGVASWDALWGLLAVIAARKCVNKAEFFGAKRRAASAEAETPSWADGPAAVDPGPTPVEAAVLAETVEQLLRGFDGDDRAIVELSLQGHTTREISDRLGLSERTVRRFRERLKRRLERMQAEGK